MSIRFSCVKTKHRTAALRCCGNMDNIFVGFLCSNFLLWSVLANECEEMRKQAASLSKTCCLLTRPSLDSGYGECVQEIRDANPDLGNTPQEKLARYICIHECIFIGAGYVDADPPYFLDMSNIEANLAKFVPEPRSLATSFLVEAYKKCEQFRKLHASQLDIKSVVDNMNVECHPFAIQITTCVLIYGMQECPDTFYLKSKQCKAAQTFFKDCLASVKRF